MHLFLQLQLGHRDHTFMHAQLCGFATPIKTAFGSRGGTFNDDAATTGRKHLLLYEETLESLVSPALKPRAQPPI